MGNLTTANIIQIISSLITFGVFIGTVKTQNAALKEQLAMQISSLEKKVDKHNSVIERMYRCEEGLKSAHYRIDELRDKK